MSDGILAGGDGRRNSTQLI